MAFSLARELSTSFCQSPTSCCHCFEYGCAGAGALSKGGLGGGADPLRQAGEVAAQPCSSSAEIKSPEMTRIFDFSHAIKIDTVAAALAAMGYELELSVR